MIAVRVEKSYGMATTAGVRVRGASIERAIRLAGEEDARAVFPIEAEPFFTAQDTQEGVEELPPVTNEEVIAA